MAAGLPVVAARRGRARRARARRGPAPAGRRRRAGRRASARATATPPAGEAALAVARERARAGGRRRRAARGLRRLSRLLAACGRWSPAGPGSSGRTSSTRCSRAATTSPSLDDLSSGSRERVPDGVALHVADIADAARDRRGARGRAARGRVPPRRAGRRAPLGRRSRARRAAQRRRDRERARGAPARAGARRVLLASTGGALYGESVALPTPEAAPLEPFSPYGTSKAAAELYLRPLHAPARPLDAGAALRQRLRPAPGPARRGRRDRDLRRRRGRGPPVTVFGDGTQTRDYVYVGDVVAGFLAAAGADATGAVNIGTGVETSVLELVRALGVQAEHAPARTGEVARCCLDVSRAADVLGWRPAVPLADGLQRTLAAVRRPRAAGPSRSPIAPRHAAQVEHRRRPLHDRPVVHPRVRRDDDREVDVAAQLAVAQPVRRQLGHVRVVVGDVAAALLQQLDDLQRRAPRAGRRRRPCRTRRPAGCASRGPACRRR